MRDVFLQRSNVLRRALLCVYIGCGRGKRQHGKRNRARQQRRRAEKAQACGGPASAPSPENRALAAGERICLTGEQPASVGGGSNARGASAGRLCSHARTFLLGRPASSLSADVENNLKEIREKAFRFKHVSR